MDDLISRQAAIDAVISLCDDCDSCYCGSCRVNYPGEKDARKALEDLPSAQQWIPCSEKLPDPEAKIYWVCTDTGYQCQCRWTNINHIWTDLTVDWHWHIMDVPRYSEVVAWMPLPEPYKAERRTDEE